VDRWEKTVIESDYTPLRPGERARFRRGGDFYEPVAGGTIRERGLQFDAGDDGDRTIIDRGPSGYDEPEDDSTVIIRDGKRGIQGPLVYFVERNGIRSGKVHLVGDETALGRGPDNDIVIANDTVSKRHGKVRAEDGEFFYWDLASANFSFLVAKDGSRKRILEPHPLKDGDTIDLGDARLTFIEVDRESQS